MTLRSAFTLSRPESAVAQLVDSPQSTTVNVTSEVSHVVPGVTPCSCPLSILALKLPSFLVLRLIIFPFLGPPLSFLPPALPLRLFERLS